MKIKHARTRLLTLTIIFTLLTPPPEGVAAAERGGQETVEPVAQTGLRFRLSEGREQVERPAPDPVAPAEVLSAAETKKLLDRLPQLTPDTNDTQDFKLRERSLPPPRTGETIQAAFAPPAPNAPPTPSHTSAPLDVLRFAPEGEVALAPAFSITFSQAMVAVSSQEETAASVPVKMTPQPEGNWRWLGAQTLVFQPLVEGGRLPMATNYTVTVPAGTKSALGNALAETKTFTFSTPPPTVKRFHPQGTGQPRDALMFIEFDQNIDAARVLERLRMQPAATGARLRLATQEEIAADPFFIYLSKEAQAGRWLVFRAVDANGATKDALPADTDIRIVVPPGTPSAEGARTTTKEQSFAFKTYGALRVTEAACGYQQRCSPFDQLHFTFNNQLDEAKFSAAQVTVKPDIPGAQISARYNSIIIAGTKRSNTTYTVTLDRAISDTFKQTLTGENVFTFKVTTAEPRLFTTGQGFAVLDPAGRRAFTVYSVNYPKLKVALYKVTPDDWPQFRRYQGARTRQNVPRTPPGKLVFNKVIEVKAATDELIETSIDLSPALTNGYGQVFVRVEPAENSADRKVRDNVYAYRQNFAEAWVQSTDIGLDAFADKRELVAWANSLTDGKPLAGVEMSVSPDGLAGTTGADGLARLPFKAAPDTKAQQNTLLVARRGDDIAIMPQQYYPSYYPDENSSWRRADSSETLRWYVFDDRKLYRPGEEVNVKGWIRKINLTSTGDTEMFTAAAGELVNYVLKDAQGNDITKGSVKLNALAGFNLKLQLPPTMNLGGTNLLVELAQQGTGHVHQFQVQEFRRPEFEITTRASEAPHFVGSFATATTTAAYFAGGGLPDTEVNWTVSSRPTSYTPPGRDDYTFGTFYAWWRNDANYYGGWNSQFFKGRTDADGKHTLRIDFDAVQPARPSSVTAEARVQDVNRQTYAATTTLLVHPADVYVGLRSARTFIQKGQVFDISTIVTDLDGRALSNRDVNLRLVRLEYVYKEGSWQQQEQDAQEQSIKSGADGVRVRFQAKEGGMYRLTARVRDERERLNESELSLWVAGGRTPPQREVAQERVELIPDRKSYAGGETAEILVQSPFAPAEGVLTLRRSGLLRTERFTMNESSHTLRIPLEEAMTPNINVQVDLVGAATRVDDAGVEMANVPKRPAYATGEINLDIPPASRRLNVKATPRETVLEPGAETLVDVEVKDAAGRAVEGTDTAVVVVDESVLALTAYSLADPLGIFYAHRSEDVNDYHLRERLKLANPAEVKEKMEEGAGAGGAGGGGVGGVARRARGVVSAKYKEWPAGERDAAYILSDANKVSESVEVSALPPPPAPTPEPVGEPTEAVIQLRQNFNALAVFAASLPTDANGRAQVKVKLPDNLTRYRIMAVSVAGGKQFGAGESNITARQPLMARPSAPRFLNFGDRAELPVVLQNQTDAAMSVAVAVRATNADLTEGAGRRVQVPANNRVEVRFPIAAVKPGMARFQIAAAAGNKADAALVAFPVYTPATTEAFATYGVIDQGAIAQPVKAPAGVVQTFGGLEVTTASTQLQELTDAVIYLVNYPYGCAEQVSSRVLALAALKDVLTAFKAKDLPTPQAMRDSMAIDLKRLQGLQNEDGGFDFWRRGNASVPFVSVHVAHALVRAQSKDFAVPAEMLSKSQNYLRQIESKIPRDYSVESKRAIRAYALYVRALMKDRDAARARKLIAEAGGVEKLSIESLGWLLPVLSGDAASLQETGAILRHLNNRVTETAGAAHFADAYSDGEYTILHSDRRADGVILEALIGEQPKSDLIPKLVRGLLSQRKRGRWSNTQENVFILLALDRYFNTYERATPDFVSRVWLGSGYAGEQTFKGRSVDRQQLNLPMSTLVERAGDAPVNLTIGKEGAGRLYFRIGTKYAPANLTLAAADYGFRVERKYEAIDDPADVRRDTDGTWHIKAGTRVRVRLTMSNPARRYHVALVDPLPAGLEALNTALATTEQLPPESTESAIYRGGQGISDFYWYRRGTWYEHQNLRDERAEAFTSLLWEGVHEYSYFTRATTPGLFVVPPPKAEEMYSPETFGRGASDRVRVE
ncbi:MAG TPA: alpha-2-macroglobulin family protein [Pyrinomonadaceae bacterium]|nr:alpha-2-macroglobulin family protein [Pyrinomonadaceae bacterium]